MVKLGSGGVTTDASGNYSISVSADATLICTCIGYKDIEQAVNGRANVNFKLDIDTQMLDETVVVGYGTLKKSQLVGSVEQISGDALEGRTNANVTRTLQGQVPGLSIFVSDGKPTHGGSVYIRGGATNYVMKQSLSKKDLQEYSIGQGGSALVLIDGVEGELSSVNPEDIESVSVLKDASSAAIYGSRAAYGVILITTKRSSSDKITVNYSGSFAINQRTVMWEDHIISDGLEFTRNFYDFWLGKTETSKVAGSAPTKMNTYNIPSDYLDLFEARRAAGNMDVYDMNGSDYLYFGSVNYFELFYKKLNTTHTHSLSINGSSDKISYSLSGRFYTQDGIYKIGHEDYNQMNLRSKVSLKLRKWLTVDNNTYFYRTGYIQPIFSKKNDHVGSQVQQIAVIGLPVLPPVNEDGTYTLGGAASGYAAFIEGNSAQESITTSVSTTTGVNVDIVKDVLKLRGDVSYKFTHRQVERYVAPTPQSNSPGVITYYVSEADSYKRVQLPDKSPERQCGRDLYPRAWSLP